ncbi:MAG: glyoxalase [Pseudomonadota bacterium]
MSPDVFGRSLSGFGVNLLVRNIAKACHFAHEVFGATIVHHDENFAYVVRGDAHDRYGWQYHVDQTYHAHPLFGIVTTAQGRGIGVELRLYDCDPDRAVSQAQIHDYIILAKALDKPHGLREAYILDADGYCWVPSTPREITR